MKHHILYIPGLGDRYSYGQDVAINLWRFYGFTPHYLPLGWRRKDGLEAKLTRILKAIDELSSDGGYVSLVGASAGAGAVLNAYAQNKTVTGVVYLCGKVNHPETVLPQIYRDNPDFKASLSALKGSLDKLEQAELSRILNIHPKRDHTVPPEDTRITGVVEEIVPGWNHASGIFAGIVFGAPIIANFLHSKED